VDAALFTTLYTANFAGLAHHVVQIVRDRHDAHDIVHDTLMKAFERDPACDAGGPPISSWLHRVAHNAALDHLRHAQRATPEEPDLIARRGEAGDHFHHEGGANAALHAALAVLPEAQRAVAILRYPGGMTPTETGAALGKSAAAVRQLELRALRSLRAALA
jgi:RNA polymerase sigma-70 factor (ECF subfamily)